MQSKNISSIFSCISGIYIKFEILWIKRWASEAICFCNYKLQKSGLLKCLKSPVSEHLWAVNMLKAPKHCLYLHCSIFVIFFHQSEIKSARKIRKFFFFIPEIYIKFWILWKKRWASEVICFWNYRLQKAGLLKCQKSSVSEHLWTVNMLMGSKHPINPHGSIFVIFFHHSERKWPRKYLF